VVEGDLLARTEELEETRYARRDHNAKR